MDIPVYDMQGKEVGTFPIDENALGGTINAALLKQAYVMYHANKRQGSARNKGRDEVALTGKKLYRQKGTGNARHGDKGANLFKGGGLAHPKKKKREDYHLDMPKKMRRVANRNALLAKILGSEEFGSEIRIIDSLSMAEPKTSAFKGVMESLFPDPAKRRKTLVALSGDPEKSQKARLSARNIDDVTLCRADAMNAFELLNHRYLVIEKAELEAWLSGASSQTGKEAKLEPIGRGASGLKDARKPRPKRGHKFRSQTVVAGATTGLDEGLDGGGEG
jgi:large subunit ribosomal protein L4